MSKNYKGNQEYGMPMLDSYGYLKVYNRKTHKKEFLHRVVWETLRGKIAPGLTIDHINSNKLDNRIENLQLLSRKANMTRNSLGHIQRTNRWVADRTIDSVRYVSAFDTKGGAYMYNMAQRYL